MRFQLLLCAIAVTIVGPTSSAQTPATPAKPAKPAVLASYELTRKTMLEAAALMREADYGVRPSVEARSFGEIVAHAVLTNFGVCAGARSEENPKKGIDFESTVTAKADLVELLAASFAYCDPAFATGGAAPGSDLLFAISHNQRMLGVLEAYLRTRDLSLTSSEINKAKKK